MPGTITMEKQPVNIVVFIQPNSAISNQARAKKGGQTNETKDIRQLFFFKTSFKSLIDEGRPSRLTWFLIATTEEMKSEI